MNPLVARAIVQDLRSKLYSSMDGRPMPLLSKCPICGAQPCIKQGRNTTKFKAGVPKWFQTWGRIRGDDKGSPLIVEGCGVLALCEHMAHTLSCDAIKYANYPCAKSSRVNLKTVCKNYKVQPRERQFRFGLFSHNHTPK